MSIGMIITRSESLTRLLTFSSNLPLEDASLPQYFISTSVALNSNLFRGERLASISDRDNDPDVSIFGEEDRETVSIAESFGVSVENRNWSKVGQTFSAVKEKGDGSAPVEEFSSAAAKIRRRRWRRGRRSRANISTTSCRVHLAVISSAATGFPQLFIESDTDTDANCNDGRQFGCCHISPFSPFPDFCPCQCRATTFSLFVRFSARERSRARIFHSTPATNYAITRKLAPRVGSGMEKVVFVDLTNEYLLYHLQ